VNEDIVQVMIANGNCSMKSSTVLVPGLACSIEKSASKACLLCHSTDMVLLSGQGDSDEVPGLCETCTELAHWAWRQQAGEAFVDSVKNHVSRVYVVIARRKQASQVDTESSPIVAPAELVSSWEFMMMAQKDGFCDLPSMSVSSLNADSSASCAMRALDNIGLASWIALLEPLYRSYTPRGHLVEVVLARGWSVMFPASLPGLLEWKSWPISAHAGPMAGFWSGFETVWPLRLHKHCAEGLSGEISVHMREAARQYVELQAVMRNGTAKTTTTLFPGYDTSMLVSLQAGMSADEIVTARLIQLAAEKEVAVKSLVAQRVAPQRRKPLVKPGKKDDWPEIAFTESSSSSENSLKDELGDLEESEMTDDTALQSEPSSDSEPIDPSFVRPRRR